MHSSLSIYQFLSLLSVIVFLPIKAAGQWRTESFELKEGWNAIYLKIDTGETPIGELVTDTRIAEVWKWRPSASDQRVVTSPEEPVTGEEWQFWKREAEGGDNTLATLAPHAAYLIRFSNNDELPHLDKLTLQIKGRVIGGKTTWRTDGLNLLGFSTPAATPPTVQEFFAPSEIVHQRTEIYSYVGGELEDEVNPAQLDLQTARVDRGKAYWIRTNKYHDYDGPLKVRVALNDGLHFGRQGTTVRLILTNRTDRPLTAELTPTDSEIAPGANEALPAVPLTRRNDEGEFVSFDGESLSLEAGETRGVTIGVNRSQLTGDPGTLAASLLKVTDGEGLSEQYLPVTAEVDSLAGLWMGRADINQVQNQLFQFKKDGDENYLFDDEGKHIIDDSKTDVTIHPTAQSFPLRLLIHVDDSGTARFLSVAYVGILKEDEILGVTTSEDKLSEAHLSSATRFSVAHLPRGIELSGTFQPGIPLDGTLNIEAKESRNPFIHTYHPDHDNLGPDFATRLDEGIESFEIERKMELKISDGPGNSFSPSWGTTLLTGTYSEMLSGLHKNSISVSGNFELRKLTSLTIKEN